MRRLLVYTENYGRGGGNRYLVDLVNAVAGDYDDVVLCSNPGGIYDEDRDRLTTQVVSRDVGIITQSRIIVECADRRSRLTNRLIALAGTLDGALLAYNRLLFRGLVWRYRPTAVLACNGGYPAARSTLALVLETGARIPTTMSVVSTPYPRREGALGEYERNLDAKVWQRAHCVIVNATTIAEMLEVRRDAPPGLVRIVHNGLPYTQVIASERHAGHVLTIGCVARFDPEKGQSTLVQAFARVASAHPDIRLVLVGEGRERQRIIEEAAVLGLRDRVSFPGHMECPIEQVLADFDIFAFPSIQEGLPYSLLEAMRAGCAIVSTDVGGIPEAVVDGETGLLVPPADVESLAAALERLVSQDALRARLALAARLRFDAEFSLDAMQVSARQVFLEAGMFAPRGGEVV